MKDLGPATYYKGIETRKFIKDQAIYVRESLDRCLMFDCNEVCIPTVNCANLNSAETNENNSPLRELIGSFMYLAMNMRPDIVHAVNAVLG